MCCSTKGINFCSMLIFFIFLFSSNLLAQLELEWSFKSPGENNIFRDIAINEAGTKIYISDSYNDVIHIFNSQNPEKPIDSFGDPSWQGRWPGPYGIDIALDQKIYIAVMLLAEGGLPSEYSLWQCLPNGKNLSRVCILPDAPRGIKVTGQGNNTIVYVSGSSGTVIKCTPVRYPFEFKAETLFITGINPQQDVLLNTSENICFTSAWWHVTNGKLVKWINDGDWILDPDFMTSLPDNGNYPSIDFQTDQDALYALRIGFLTDESYLYKINVAKGTTIGSPLKVGEGVVVSDGRSAGAGGIDIFRKNEIYFAGAIGYDDEGNYISIYGKVKDVTPNVLEKRVPYELHETQAQKQNEISHLLLKTYPNPFNPSTYIYYNLSQESVVELNIYNTQGQLVATLVNSFQSQGEYQVPWHPVNLSSGVYIIDLRAGNYQTTEKILFMK